MIYNNNSLQCIQNVIYSVEICGFIHLKYILSMNITKKVKHMHAINFWKEDIPKMKESKLLFGMYS